MAIAISGRLFWLWRAVDDEGEVLDLLVERRRDKGAALKLMRRLLKKHGFAPAVLMTDRLRSYGAAKSEMGLSACHQQGLRLNNRAENSHQPVRRREREMQRFKITGSGSALPIRSRRRPQHFQRPAPSRVSQRARGAPRRGSPDVASGYCCLSPDGRFKYYSAKSGSHDNATVREPGPV